ncbi:hypothetical protein KXQ82_07605 [Mucilaginibacter sp. HMF5004]|uniref:MG2 domain-containing protein n=1 Tax=Mucilaginibacter rivuli TaxID=2857527 RepID=UPI001C5F7337|nr:MG2 domain-containing protein [Mucilaginibacter rivuli]MBW4889575.1 hypothetical protein [Mucilaginibacter rivuli]
MSYYTRILLFIVLILRCAITVNAQQTIPLFFEKVYLHTDRDVYTQGENIWFKAYLVDAQNNKPINYSHNLYVELISPGLKIKQHHLIRLENGLGTGDFKLPDTISAGKYRIRAYTNWMRNFGDNFVFEKNITVVNASDTKTSAAAQIKPVRRLKKKQPVISKQDTLPSGPLVRFLPEGGTLVNDVTSVVAVKAEDEHGKGIPVNGTVLASSGRVVAKFTCDSLGFGSFNLTPDETQRYHANVMIKNQPYDFKLRNSTKKGFVMGVSVVSPSIAVDISCSERMLRESGGANLVIIARHGGKIIYNDQLRVQSKEVFVNIPDANFPEGIAAITLYDDHSVPLCERLVYVRKPGNYALKVNTDKALYKSKEKVTVKIKLDKTQHANLSLSAIDENVSAVKPENILTYLELTSELKGVIEHPERYFDTTNTNRYKQLDLLLLTQGWRDFVWKRIADTTLKISYEVEQAISITGRVRKVWADKPMPNINVTMFAPKATGDKLFTAVTDSSGRFNIDGAVFYGYQYLNFTSRSSNGIKADGRSKGKTGGYIRVDSLFRDSLPVHAAVLAPEDTIPLTSDALIARDKIRQKFSFEGVNNLSAVQIKGYTNMLPEEVHPITLAEQKDYGSLLQYLLYMIGGTHSELGNGCHVQVEDPSPGIILQYGYFPAHTVSIRGVYSDNSKIDYRFVCDDDYLGQPMDHILKVTINRRETVYGIMHSVFVVMRPGVLEKDVFDHTMANIEGYAKERTFFAPRYEAPDTKPDYRTTIHWEPNITTNANGEATISFYNADPKSKIRLVVQGITDKGIPVVASSVYEVK